MRDEGGVGVPGVSVSAREIGLPQLTAPLGAGRIVERCSRLNKPSSFQSCDIAARRVPAAAAHFPCEGSHNAR